MADWKTAVLLAASLCIPFTNGALAEDQVEAEVEVVVVEEAIIILEISEPVVEPIEQEKAPPAQTDKADKADNKPAEADAKKDAKAQPKPAGPRTVKGAGGNAAGGPFGQAAGDDAEDPAKPVPTEQDLRREMQALEAQLQQKRREFEQKVNEARKDAQAKKPVPVEDIVLPENPTREQSEKYIQDLREAKKGNRSYSSSDPVVEKLKALPAEHFDLLVNEMANRTTLRYFANYAMREIDPEVLRERFVSTLDQNDNNIGVIVMNGWCEDVRPIIIKHIQNAEPATIKPAWFQAAVELEEPSLYPKLHEVTTNSRYASQFVTMLRSLPDYDLGHTVNTCWERARDGKLTVSQTSFAELAVQFGNVDALGMMVSQVQYSRSFMVSSSSYNTRRASLLRYIDFRGSNTEIQAWYSENKDKLVFDHFRKRFVVPEDF